MIRHKFLEVSNWFELFRNKIDLREGSCEAVELRDAVQVATAGLACKTDWGWRCPWLGLLCLSDGGGYDWLVELGVVLSFQPGGWGSSGR